MTQRRSWNERFKAWRSSGLLRGVACVSILLLVGFNWMVFESYRTRRIIEDWQERGIRVQYSARSPEWLIRLGPPIETVVNGVIRFRRVEKISVGSVEPYATNENDLFSPEDIQNLERMPELLELVIMGYPVTDKDLSSIGKLSRLKYLRIHCPDVSASGIGEIKKLKQLDYLRLDGQVNLLELELSQLAELPKLSELMLMETPLTEIEIEQISKIKTLGTLGINGSKLTGNDFQSLEQMKNIKHLYVQDATFSGIFLKEIERRMLEQGIRVSFVKGIL